MLIPDIFLRVECGGVTAIATQRLDELRAAAAAAGVGQPLIGGGWQNPSVPAGTSPPTPLPHPDGYMRYNTTVVNASVPSIIKVLTVASAAECKAACNATAECVAAIVARVPAPPAAVDGVAAGSSSGGGSNRRDQHESDSGVAPRRTCTLMSVDGPGAYSSTQDTYVRVHQPIEYEWTGSYNAAPPVCPKEPNWVRVVRVVQNKRSTRKPKNTLNQRERGGLSLSTPV